MSPFLTKIVRLTYINLSNVLEGKKYILLFM